MLISVWSRFLVEHCEDAVPNANGCPGYWEFIRKIHARAHPLTSFIVRRPRSWIPSWSFWQNRSCYFVVSRSGSQTLPFRGFASISNTFPFLTTKCHDAHVPLWRCIKGSIGGPRNQTRTSFILNFDVVLEACELLDGVFVCFLDTQGVLVLNCNIVRFTPGNV